MHTRRAWRGSVCWEYDQWMLRCDSVTNDVWFNVMLIASGFVKSCLIWTTSCESEFWIHDMLSLIINYWSKIIIVGITIEINNIHDDKINNNVVSLSVVTVHIAVSIVVLVYRVPHDDWWTDELCWQPVGLLQVTVREREVDDIILLEGAWQLTGVTLL